MSNELSFLALLYDKTENLIITSLRLWQLKSLTKFSEVISGVIANFILLTGLIFFVLFLNIGVAFWISDYFDSNYSGFIMVAIFNLVFALIIGYFFKKTIHSKVKNLLFASQFGKTINELESENQPLEQTIIDFRVKQEEEMLRLKEHLAVIEDNIQPVNVIKNSIAQIKETLDTKAIWIDLFTIGISLLLAQKKRHLKKGDKKSDRKF